MRCINIRRARPLQVIPLVVLLSGVLTFGGYTIKRTLLSDRQVRCHLCGLTGHRATVPGSAAWLAALTRN